MAFDYRAYLKKNPLLKEEYTSFDVLSDNDLESIAQWGLNDEFDFSACEDIECVVKSFKSSLSVSYPKGLGNVPNELKIYRIIRLKDKKGGKHSLDTIEKMRKAKIGKKYSEESKQKMKKPKSEEHKQKISKTKQGKIKW